MFVAIDPEKLRCLDLSGAAIDWVVADLKGPIPVSEGKDIAYPGERTLAAYKSNLDLGIPVMDVIWQKICGLAWEDCLRAYEILLTTTRILLK